MPEVGLPRPGEAGVPASDRVIGGLIARRASIVGSDLDELICIKLYQHHPHPVVIIWGSACHRPAGRTSYSISLRTAGSNTWFDKGFCNTCLMPSSAARRSRAGSVVAVIMIVGTWLPRDRSCETNSRPLRSGN
jgi:hypothetical protein